MVRGGVVAVTAPQFRRIADGSPINNRCAVETARAYGGDREVVRDVVHVELDIPLEALMHPERLGDGSVEVDPTGQDDVVSAQITERVDRRIGKGGRIQDLKAVG